MPPTGSPPTLVDKLPAKVAAPAEKQKTAQSAAIMSPKRMNQPEAVIDRAINQSPAAANPVGSALEEGPAGPAAAHAPSARRLEINRQKISVYLAVTCSLVSRVFDRFPASCSRFPCQQSSNVVPKNVRPPGNENGANKSLRWPLHVA